MAQFESLSGFLGRREKLERDVSSPELTKPLVSVEELERICEGNEDLQVLLQEMLDSCARYTETVCRFEEIALKDRSETIESGDMEEIDTLRRRTHNAMIDSVNILARNLTKQGKGAPWARALSDRSKHAKFAITLTFARFAEHAPA